MRENSELDDNLLARFLADTATEQETNGLLDALDYSSAAVWQLVEAATLPSPLDSLGPELYGHALRALHHEGVYAGEQRPGPAKAAAITNNVESSSIPQATLSVVGADVTGTDLTVSQSATNFEPQRPISVDHAKAKRSSALLARWHPPLLTNGRAIFAYGSITAIIILGFAIFHYRPVSNSKVAIATHPPTSHPDTAPESNKVPELPLPSTSSVSKDKSRRQAPYLPETRILSYILLPSERSTAPNVVRLPATPVPIRFTVDVNRNVRQNYRVDFRAANGDGDLRFENLTSRLVSSGHRRLDIDLNTSDLHGGEYLVELYEQPEPVPITKFVLQIFGPNQ